jgi:hypothetical protein
LIHAPVPRNGIRKWISSRIRVRGIGDASQIYLELASIQTREGEADRTPYGALYLFGVDVSKFAS